MSNSSALPNPDLVYNTYTGTYEIQLVRIALRLDVFTPLVNGPANAATVAQACGCDSTGIRVLRNYLTALKLLEQRRTPYPSNGWFYWQPDGLGQ